MTPACTRRTPLLGASLTGAIALAVGDLRAQTVTVPAGTPVLVETQAPIAVTTHDVGKRFGAVLADDVIVEFMLVAPAGALCRGEVTKQGTEHVTLTLTLIRGARGDRAVVAGAPRFGPEPPPQPKVTGFGGAFAPPGGDMDAAAARTGKAVLSENGELSVPAKALLEFTLDEEWSVPLGETVSVFPQPEDAQPDEGPRPVPRAWYSQAAPKQPRPRQPRTHAPYRRGYPGWGRGGRFGSGFTMPDMWPGAVTPMTPDRRATMGTGPVTIPEGTSLIARTSERIDSSQVEPGAPFTGILMTDLAVDGRIVVNRGARADGIITVGKAGEQLLPTLALRRLQVGGLDVAIQTGPVRVLYLPARHAERGAIGVGGAAAAAAAPPTGQPPGDGALRLDDGTILEFSLARPVKLQ